MFSALDKPLLDAGGEDGLVGVPFDMLHMSHGAQEQISTRVQGL